VSLPASVRRSAVHVIILAFVASLLTAVMTGPAGAADGDLDPTFSGDGRVVTDFGFDDRAEGLAVQPDGRIVVAGTSCGGDFLVARYNTDGSPDTTFAGDGATCIDIGAGSADRGDEVIVLSGGQLLIAGTSAGNFALVRLTADGTLDPSFGTGGRATYDAGGTDELRDAVVRPDGTIVMVGETSRVGCPQAPTMAGQTVAVAVVRALSGGAPDPGFGGGGTVVLADENLVQRGFAVAVQNDGGVVVGGLTSTCSRVSIDTLLVRLTAAGTPGAPFSESPFDEVSPDSANDLAVQPNGGIVVAVDTFVGPALHPARDDAFTVLRYNANGSSDTTFGLNGVATALFGAGTNATARAITLQGSKIVVGGTVDGDFALARFDANGALDPTFGGDGMVVTDFGGVDVLYALAVQPDGALVAAGQTGTNVALARYGTGSTSTTSTSVPSTTTTTTGGLPSPFVDVCALLARLRSSFTTEAVLQPFVGIIDTVRTTLGCTG
jgi:uncharacterized delta-60 repeat protein